jgi:ATP-dependent DNA ligase
MDRPGGKPAAHRRLAAGLLHRRWTPALRGSRRHRHERSRTGATCRSAVAVADAEDASCRPAPRDNRFGSPLKLSKVHWVRPEVVVEVTYLTWTEGGLLRAVSYQGQREDKPARQVVRFIPHPQ